MQFYMRFGNDVEAGGGSVGMHGTRGGCGCGGCGTWKGTVAFAVAAEAIVCTLVALSLAMEEEDDADTYAYAAMGLGTAVFVFIVWWWYVMMQGWRTEQKEWTFGVYLVITLLVGIVAMTIFFSVDCDVTSEPVDIACMVALFISVVITYNAVAVFTAWLVKGCIGALYMT